ncbi:uncharacterized protein SETTUDRAFT_153220 [Exserohilum turcica Et28A]|uniref:Aquaporin n=1 Tax=Exserohilum turcicum (strain 28A) TaxID=671987 RepID=R0J5S7_EXST2|nr:uncharacterized protein SETTUDRAFT_153220 [Exserohilum turcica Et28A]EOA92260.1 hypothetical protein SETTUDRAFT_153220 [Exserohilum turcica Et28A]
MRDKPSDEKSKPSILPFHTITTSSLKAPSTDESTTPRTTTFRTEIAAFIGELIGTFMFLFMAFTAAQIAVNSTSSSSSNSNSSGLKAGATPPPDLLKLLYISLAFSMSLAVNVAIFADISGAKFVTTALVLTRKIHWHRALHTILAQLVAAATAAALVSTLIPTPLTIDTTISPSTSIGQAVLLETFATFQLILTILMLEGSSAKPMYIGLALFITQISTVFFSGGSLNPARSFGPAVLNGFLEYHWVYWVGPLLGAGLASGVYWVIGFVRREADAF